MKNNTCDIDLFCPKWGNAELIQAGNELINVLMLEG